ncbi:hypothetical protein CF647_28790 [Burkholderia sp. 117]|nr:hypothetical protein CF649_28885 [Burkholderia sp. 136(2017)]PNX11526.1 hypothetical protein CF650_30150 [Burkholderia sp. 129]PNX25874.1 hypothetical protein CF647_28790 [Burkholderia sp. 117]PNX34269.1 hypothetical protein CF648_28890 [Burkholderia sp. 137]
MCRRLGGSRDGGRRVTHARRCPRACRLAVRFRDSCRWRSFGSMRWSINARRCVIAMPGLPHGWPRLRIGRCGSRCRARRDSRTNGVRRRAACRPSRRCRRSHGPNHSVNPVRNAAVRSDNEVITRIDRRRGNLPR